MPTNQVALVAAQGGAVGLDRQGPIARPQHASTRDLALSLPNNTQQHRAPRAPPLPYWQATLIAKLQQECGLTGKQAGGVWFHKFLSALAKRPRENEMLVLKVLAEHAGGTRANHHSPQCLAAAAARGECIRCPALMDALTEQVSWEDLVTCMVDLATSPQRAEHYVRELAMGVLTSVALSCASCPGVGPAAQLLELLDCKISMLVTVAALHGDGLPPLWLHCFGTVVTVVLTTSLGTRGLTLQKVGNLLNVLLGILDLLDASRRERGCCIKCSNQCCNNSFPDRCVPSLRLWNLFTATCSVRFGSGA